MHPHFFLMQWMRDAVQSNWRLIPGIIHLDAQNVLHNERIKLLYRDQRTRSGARVNPSQTIQLLSLLRACDLRRDKPRGD